MIVNKLEELIIKGCQKARSKGFLNYKVLPTFSIEVPRSNFGDWATNVAFLLSRETKRKPLEIAQIIVKEIPASSLVEKIETAGGGFINFFLSPTYVVQELSEILTRGSDYGRQDIGRGEMIQVEFVSANPVGPLHLGHGRWAAVGDSLANLLEKIGYKVVREFYVNDAGTQMEVFARSVSARYLELLGRKVEFPEDGYHGHYIYDIAQEIINRYGEKFADWEAEEREKAFRELAYEQVLSHLEKTLIKLGVKFDVWFKERSLYQENKIEEAVELLRKKGFVYEKDGAVWLKTTLFGDDKDRVLVRESGEPTYFAADIAYHLNKRERGFKKVIDIWGADHHGYVPRMKAAMRALGFEEEFLEVIIGQLVNLYRGGQPVRMSKRTGEMVTLEELIEEVGPDAIRYYFASRDTNSPLDFDIEVAKAETSENPVFYIQYAHARLASLFRKAREKGIDLSSLSFDSLGELREAEELSLAKKLFLFPYIVEIAARTRAPFRLTNYALEVASLFHVFYTECRVIGAGEGLEEARLLLSKATKIVLGEALRLLGIKAPQKM